LRAAPAPAADAGELEEAQRIVDAGEPSPYDPYDHELYAKAKRRIVELEAIRRDLNRSLEVDNAAAAKLAEELASVKRERDELRERLQRTITAYDFTAVALGLPPGSHPIAEKARRLMGRAEKAEAALETARAECEAMRAVCEAAARWRDSDAPHWMNLVSYDLRNAVDALRAAQGKGTP
jgi:DNA repair exonuclease SbcCD ATPase subunit